MGCMVAHGAPRCRAGAKLLECGIRSRRRLASLHIPTAQAPDSPFQQVVHDYERRGQHWLEALSAKTLRWSESSRLSCMKGIDASSTRGRRRRASCLQTRCRDAPATCSHSFCSPSHRRTTALSEGVALVAYPLPGSSAWTLQSLREPQGFHEVRSIRTFLCMMRSRPALLRTSHHR